MEGSEPMDGEFDPSHHLLHADVAVDSVRQLSYLAVCIKQSKTDPFQKRDTSNHRLCGRPIVHCAAILVHTVLKKPGEGLLF